MATPSVAQIVKRHVRLHAAQRVIELYNAGESFATYLDELSPEMRRTVEGLLRAAAESWGNAVAERERGDAGENDWLR